MSEDVRKLNDSLALCLHTRWRKKVVDIEQKTRDIYSARVWLKSYE